MTETLLKRAHYANSAGTPLHALARSFGVDGAELGKRRKLFRAKHGLDRPLHVKEINKRLAAKVGRKVDQ